MLENSFSIFSSLVLWTFSPSSWKSRNSDVHNGQCKVRQHQRSNKKVLHSFIVNFENYHHLNGMRTANSDWKSANQKHNELRIKLARFVSVQRRFARWQRSKGSCGVCETSKISSTQWSLFWNEAIWAFDVCNIKPRLWSSEPRTFCVCSNIKKRVVLIVCEPASSGSDENIAQRFYSKGKSAASTRKKKLLIRTEEWDFLC